ncbi:MAG: aminotransferase class V-fold PLP-dependent enzyme [Saprospiraceae bacterium]
MSQTTTGTELKSLFLLDPSITYLNYGSFGACPREIFEAYQRYQLELEREPVHFITRAGMEYAARSRKELADYLHCDTDDIVWTMNPSFAVNIIAKSFALSPGDEILATDLEYGACDKTWDYYCEKAGAKYRRQKINLPVLDAQQIVEDLFKGFGPRTRLVFVSHLTSSTGMILPVHDIVREAHRRGVPCFVDGAHAPGQIGLDLTALDADMYVGACHKWMLSPKGCSFLYVRHSLQDVIDPLIISWGYKAMFPGPSRFQDYHMVQGTRDYSAFLTIPHCLEFMRKFQWDKVRSQCRAMVRSNATRFYQLLESDPICPIDEEFIAQMLSIPIRCAEPELLYKTLFEKYNIEIPVMRQDDRVYLRYSINAFNQQEDLDRLYDALLEIKGEGQLLGL